MWWRRAASIAINAAKLQFIPTSGRPPELTDDLLEGFAVLSQTIYFENYLFLTIDGIEPKMTVRIENEFRHELPASLSFVPSLWCGFTRKQRIYPLLFEIGPLTMRTRAWPRM